MFELLAVHLLPEALLLSLFLEYGVEEQHLIFLERTELVPCQWQRLAGLGCGDGTRGGQPHLAYCAPPTPLVWLPEMHKFHAARARGDAYSVRSKFLVEVEVLWSDLSMKNMEARAPPQGSFRQMHRLRAAAEALGPACMTLEEAAQMKWVA